MWEKSIISEKVDKMEILWKSLTIVFYFDTLYEMLTDIEKLNNSVNKLGMH